MQDAGRRRPPLVSGIWHPVSRPLVRIPFAFSMPDSSPNPELLRSLGQLVRGLSVLFWGLPVALVVCVQTAVAEYFRMLGVLPPILATGVLVYGLTLLGHFRKEERIWVVALERVKIIAVVNLGLSPFLYWWSKVPGNLFYLLMTQLLAVSGLVFLLLLNPLLRRLTAMLPDETLRHETLVFTKLNSAMLGLNFLLLLASLVLFHLRGQAIVVSRWQGLLERSSQWVMWFLILLTTATTMALIWKTKEVIFNSVFGGQR